MLTVNIVRRCLESLLRIKDEESLECLCKLLTTIGKELEKSCSLAEIVAEMKRITEGKRQPISSRIRFMLQDVIDLRDSRWVGVFYLTTNWHLRLFRLKISKVEGRPVSNVSYKNWSL